MWTIYQRFYIFSNLCKNDWSKINERLKNNERNKSVASFKSLGSFQRNKQAFWSIHEYLMTSAESGLKNQVKCIFKLIPNSTFLNMCFNDYVQVLFQPWESAAAFGNAVVNAVLCWFYDSKKKCRRKGFHICGLSFQVLQRCW